MNLKQKQVEPDILQTVFRLRCRCHIEPPEGESRGVQRNQASDRLGVSDRLEYVDGPMKGTRC